MAILKCASGEVEIRLRRLQVDGAEPKYFDEFVNLGDILSSRAKNQCTRYIVPDDTHYAVELIVKEGFDFEGCDGVRVRIYDKASDGFIGQKAITKGDMERTPGDKLVVMETVSGGIIDGMWVKDATLMFKELTMDENLDKETEIAGVSVANLGGLRIRVSKYSRGGEVTLSQEQFTRQVARFEARHAAQAQKIDESSFNKDGITHAVRMSGGFVARRVGVPTQTQRLRKDSDRLDFDFISRSQEFLENNLFVKCPIPLELHPWSSLTSTQRSQCFKVLQTHDKEETLAQNIAKAGPDADVESIKKKMYRTKNGPTRWRPWDELSDTEKKAMFLSLQQLRVDSERRKISPALMTLRSPVNDQNVTLAEARTPPPGAQVLPPAPQYIVDFEPVARPGTPIRASEPLIIILDDTPPRGNPRVQPVKRARDQAGTQAEPIDLDTFVFRSIPIIDKASRIKIEIDGQRAPKRTKLNPSAGDAARLELLRQELQRRTLEIEEAENVARLRREADELQTKIEDIEKAKEEEKEEDKSGSAS